MEARISKMQYFFLMPCLVYAKAIGITAGVIVRQVGADAWTAMLIGFLLSIVIIVIAILLGAKYPEKTIIQYSEDLLGGVVSKLIGSVLAIYFLIAFAVSSNVLVLHLKEYMLTETPFIVLCIAYIALCLVGVLFGIEVVIRFSLFGLFMILAINITMILGTLGDFQLINLRPLFSGGIIENLKAGTYVFCDTAMAILATAMMYPMIGKKEKITSISIWSMLLATVLVVTWPFFEAAVLGADVMKQFVIVCMQQVRSAQLTRYLPRYELIMVSFFVWGLFVQSSVMLYCSMYGLKQVTKIKKDWHILIPLTILSVLITYYTGKDHNYYVHFLQHFWSRVSMILGIGLPVLLYLLSFIRKKKAVSRNLQN